MIELKKKIRDGDDIVSERSISLRLNPHCALASASLLCSTEQKRQDHKNGKAHFKKEIIQHKTGRRTLT